MFLFVVGTHTKCVIIEFALDARTDILIFPCHTVTNGIDLRRPPRLYVYQSFPPSLKKKSKIGIEPNYILSALEIPSGIM